MPQIKDITRYRFHIKYVHFIWDNALTGKKMLCANNIDELILQVESMVEPSFINKLHKNTTSSV